MSERVFEPIPGGWRFDLPDLQTSFDAVHLRHERGDIFAEVTVRTNWPTVRTIAGVIYQATTNLSKATNRKMFADALVDRDAPGHHAKYQPCVTVAPPFCAHCQSVRR